MSAIQFSSMLLILKNNNSFLSLNIFLYSFYLVNDTKFWLKRCFPNRIRNLVFGLILESQLHFTNIDLFNNSNKILFRWNQDVVVVVACIFSFYFVCVMSLLRGLIYQYARYLWWSIFIQFILMPNEFKCDIIFNITIKTIDRSKLNGFFAINIHSTLHNAIQFNFWMNLKFTFDAMFTSFLPNRIFFLLPYATISNILELLPA